MTAPKEPLWLTRAIIEAVHTDQIRQHGGSFGIRDGAAPGVRARAATQSVALRAGSGCE